MFLHQLYLMGSRSITPIVLIVLPILVIFFQILREFVFYDFTGFDVITIFNYAVIIIMFIVFPMRHVLYSYEKYFMERGFSAAVYEYDFLKKISVISLPLLIILTIISFVQPAIELPIKSQIENAFIPDIDSQIGYDIGSRIGAEEGSKFGSKIGAQLALDIGSKIGAQIGAEIGAQFGSRIGEDIGAAMRSELGPRLESILKNETLTNTHFNKTGIRSSHISIYGILPAIWIGTFLIASSALLNMIILLIKREFRYFYATGCFVIMTRSYSDVEKMSYLILGIKSYDSYLVRNLGLRINNLVPIFSKIGSLPENEQMQMIKKISESFMNLRSGTLEPVRLLSLLTNVPESEFLIPGRLSFTELLTEWSGIAAGMTSILGTLVTQIYIPILK
jgi:hypothetical protein